MDSKQAMAEKPAGASQSKPASPQKPQFVGDGKEPTNADKEEATLTMPDGSVYKLPVFRPSLGPERLVDIRFLYAQSKILTYDPGFNSTASCQSAITYIDGDAGVCLYRGHAVHELIENGVSYPEVCHLLLYGTLPGPTAKTAFLAQLQKEMLVHEQLKVFVQTFISGSHPMSILSSVVAAMASFYADPMSGDHVDNWEARELACIRLIAKLPSIVAMIYKVKCGMPIVYPRSDLSYSENILNMMFGTPMEPYIIEPAKAEIIDAFLTIHADHEQNASTSTVRTAGSSLANPYACIAAGITSLWGRAHGGANEAVIKMLEEIGDESKLDDFIAKVKAKEVRLMGFGHRIYRNYDPRAKVMRNFCSKLFKQLGSVDPLFNVAMKLERMAIEDTYFSSRKLYPNVDFYSGIVMRCLGIPMDMFTVFFALGRCVGWLSHWKEMIEEKQLKISRPRQLYVGVGRCTLEEAEQEEEPHAGQQTQTAAPKASPAGKLRRGETEELMMSEAAATSTPFHQIAAKMGKQRVPRMKNFKNVEFEYDVWGETRSYLR